MEATVSDANAFITEAKTREWPKLKDLKKFVAKYAEKNGWCIRHTLCNRDKRGSILCTRAGKPPPARPAVDEFPETPSISTSVAST